MDIQIALEWSAPGHHKYILADYPRGSFPFDVRLIFHLLLIIIFVGPERFSQPKVNHLNSMIRVPIIIVLFSLLLFSCGNDMESLQLKKAKVSGFVQKGTFVSGTTILMNELNAKLEQTGRAFTSTISKDNGLFELNNILLGSRYVEITASGYYFNEVSGQLSNSQLVLSSFSDLQDKNSINVNVLTHLEKQRLQNLIGRGISFSEAKAQSRREVLSIFSASLTGDIEFEDFDVLENTQEGGVLLAISIILQHERTVGQLTELLSRIQQDIAIDGTLDDLVILKNLRFGVMDLDMPQIRKNIESRMKELNISTPVPDFESHIIAFAKLKDLNIVIDGEGSVDERIVPGQTGRSYPQGLLVELTAVPKPGWLFDGWGGDLTGSESPKQILLDAPKSVTAKFKRLDYLLNITIQGEGMVNESVVYNPVGKTYPFQTIVELTPVPAPGSVFERWGGDLSGSEVPVRVTLDKEKSIVAVFRKPVFRIHENGLTCVCENVKPGEKGVTNGLEYEAVDDLLIRTRRDEGKDMTRLCTSLVTDLTGLFANRTFNQAIGNWDVSNVTKMDLLFQKSNFNQDISLWNVGRVTSMSLMFAETPFNKDISGWNVGNVRSMHRMFEFSSFNQPIGGWNVSNVTDMWQMFRESPFNQPIGGWDVSSVTAMAQMFMNTPFNQPIGNWNVANVTEMGFLFCNSNFNQDIGNWNVGKVTSMALMFSNSRFNRDISRWNVSNVRSMHRMFEFTPFNQPLSDWDVSNVTNMDQMFRETPFNQPIGSWNVSNVTGMYQMFMNTPFNQPIGNWNVGNVATMEFMFANSNFNQDIGNWDVSRVASMMLMFANSPFNRELNSWNVSSVRNMHRMFESSSFNKPIGSWNVSAVTDMSQMFNFTSFDQDIGNWNVSNVRSMHHMFSNSSFNQDLSRWCVVNFSAEPDGFSAGAPLTETNKPRWGTCPN